MSTLLRTLRLTVTLLALLASYESYPMSALDSAKYFSDPKVAALVDDIQRGDVEKVKLALASGVKADAAGINGFRPIHFVFVAKDAAVLRVLLAAGADPMARLENGNTPLHFAVRLANPDFTAALLAAHADPNAKGENDKPVIHEALSSHEPKILRLLANAGANVNVEWGNSTPVLAAVTIYQWEMAATLLSLNADIHFRNRAGKSVIDRFCERVDRVPPNSTNNRGVPLLFAAFQQRGIPLPCQALEQKFR